MRSSKTASGYSLVGSVRPCDVDVFTPRGEFDQLSTLATELLGMLKAREVYCDDGRKMTWPFAFGEVLAVAGGNDVSPSHVSLVNPVLVEKHVVFTTAPEAAIENVVAAFNGHSRSLTNDQTS